MARIYDHITKEWVNVSSANEISIKDISESFNGAVNVEEALQHVAGDLANKENNINDIINTLSEQTEKIDWLMVNGGGGTGGGGGSSAPTLTSRIVESSFVVDKGTDVILPLYFTSPNLGDGVLIVTVDDKDWDTYPIKQGSNNVNIGALPNLSNKVSVSAKDRVGMMSNPIDWEVICGGIDLTLDFDYNVDYNIGSDIHMPFTVYNPTKDPVTLTLTIDGDVKKIPCIQGYNEYLFKDLNVGIHRVTIQATDGTFNSKTITFNLVIVDSNSLYLSTTFINGTNVEFGVPLIIDYRISNPTDEIMTVNQYLDDTLVKTLEAKRGSYSWTLNNLAVKEGYHYKIQVTNTKGEIRELTGTFNIVQGDFSPIQINTQGLVYRLDASTRTNQDLDKANPVINDIQATLHGFNFASDGWLDGVLKCNASSYVEIDYAPWGENAPNGSTIELLFKSQNIGEDKAKILNYTDSATNKGIYIGFDEAKIGSITNTAQVFLNSGEWTTVSFVLDRKTRFAKIFINGICTRAFTLSDSGSGVETVLEDFIIDNKIYLNCDNNKEYCGATEIKDLRIYRRALTDDEIVNNVIAQEENLIHQKLLHDFNFANKTLPTIRMYGNTDNMTLENHVPMRVKYSSPNTEKYGQPFDFPYCEVYWQGTSSLDYVLKNYNIKLKDENNADAYYTPYPNGVTENLFCLKADYMESSHSRNVGIAKFVEHCMYDTKNPAQLKDNKIRNCVEGFPILLYINDKLQGIYNFNTDRYSVKTYGYTDPNKHLVYEISANSDTTAGAFFKWKPFVQGKLKYYKNSISSGNNFNNDNGLVTQYIEVEENSKITFNPGSEWTSNDIELLGYTGMDNIRRYTLSKGGTMTLPSGIRYIRVNKWNNLTDVPTTININGKDYILEQGDDKDCIHTLYKDNLGSSKTELDYYKSDFRCIYPPTRVAGNDNFAEIKRLVEWVDDASDEDFRDNLDHYFNREYLIRYYLFAMLFGAVDSLGKNMKLASWDGKIWYPQVYDADTTIGLDNTGFLKFDMDIEVGDKGVYNTTSSRLWSKVKLLLWDEITSEYVKLRNNNLTLNNMIKYIVDDQMDKIPATYYNKDMQTKYLNFGSSYLYALHGKGEHQIKYWLQGRLIYLDTLLDYNVSTSDYVTIRSSKLGEVYLDIQTFNSMYLTIKWRNTQDGSADQVLRVKKGKTTRFSFQMPTATDQEIRIYGGKHLKSVGDLTNLAPTTVLLAKAPNITELICHSPNLINTDLSECTNLQKVDLQDCTQLGSGVSGQSIIDVSKCNNIHYINCKNTQITAIHLNPTGNYVKEIWYPSSIQMVSLSNCPSLEIIGLSKGHSCKVLKLVNCPNVKEFGTRVFNQHTGKYDVSQTSILHGVNELYLDNSFNTDIEDFYLDTGTLTSLTLKNFENLTNIRIHGPNYQNQTLKDETLNKLETYSDFKLETFNCPSLQGLYFTTIYHKDGDNTGVHFTNSLSSAWQNETNGASRFRTIDLTKTNLNTFIAHTGIVCKNLLLPMTLKKFISNPITNTTHTINKGNENGEFDCFDTHLHNICTHMRGMGGNLIFNIATSLDKLKNNPTGHWNFDELLLDDLYIWHNGKYYEGYNCNYFSESIYLPLVDNFHAIPINYAMPLRNVRLGTNNILDFTKFKGKALAYTLYKVNDSNVTLRLPEVIDWDVLYYREPINYLTTNQIGWNDPFISKYFSLLKSDVDAFKGVQLREQTSIEDGAILYNEIISPAHAYATNMIAGSNLKYIKRWELPNVTKLGYPFHGDTKTLLEIGDIIAPKCTNTSSVFQGQTALQKIGNITLASTGDITLHSMYHNCTSLISVGNISANTTGKVDIQSIFNNCTNLVNVGDIIISDESITNCSYIYYNCHKLENVGTVHIGICENFYGGFYRCYKLRRLKIKGNSLNSNLCLFHNTSALENLDLTEFTIGGDCGYMFEYSGVHGDVTLNGSLITNVYAMFYQSSNVQNITINNDIEGHMGSFAWDCGKLETVTLSRGWDNTTNHANSFQGCKKLREVLGVGDIIPPKTTDTGYMFQWCESLEKLYVITEDCTQLTRATSMYHDINFNLIENKDYTFTFVNPLFNANQHMLLHNTNTGKDMTFNGLITMDYTKVTKMGNVDITYIGVPKLKVIFPQKLLINANTTVMSIYGLGSGLVTGLGAYPRSEQLILDMSNTEYLTQLEALSMSTDMIDYPMDVTGINVPKLKVNGDTYHFSHGWAGNTYLKTNPFVGKFPTNFNINMNKALFTSFDIWKDILTNNFHDISNSGVTKTISMTRHMCGAKDSYGNYGVLTDDQINQLKAIATSKGYTLSI